jgi:hypothetical protein
MPVARRAIGVALGACILFAIAVTTTPVFAQSDGAYGRLEGDVLVTAGVGAALAQGGPSFAARGSALYLDTGGVYVLYTDAFGAGGPAVARSVACGLSLKPLFLARYASNLERGPARLDLLIDSIGIDLGTFWHAPAGMGLMSRPGLEIGLGVDVPILGRATGPYIEARGALRWREEDLDGHAKAPILSRGALLSIAIAWHHVIGAGVVDLGDESRR